MTDVRIAAVVLAAGASVRMGAPKPLVQWRGRTFVGHVVDRAVAAGCEPIIVVEGAHAIPPDEVEPARIAVNAAWIDGPTTSLQAGLVVLDDVDAVIVATVDRPHVALDTWVALVDAHAREPTAIWQPRHAGQRGHPVVLPSWLLPRVRGLAASDTLRDLLARPDVAPSRREIDVVDPAVLDNLDSPEDLSRLPA